MDEVPLLLFVFPFVREHRIVDGWLVRCGFRQDCVGVYAGEVVILVDAKDVTKETVVRSHPLWTCSTGM